MKILALDTSTLMATCAVIEDNRLLGEYSINQDMSHSENLMPMIEEIMDNLNMDIKDIDLYGVAVGPGSFTGLRIGVATIKAFAHLFNKPVVAVSTLEALAYNMAYSNIVIPILDARRDRVYTAIYKWEDGQINQILEPSIQPIEDILDMADDYNRVVFNGDGTIVYRENIEERLKDKADIARIGQNVCKAASIGEIAKIKYDKGEVDDHFTLSPEYLRETKAQRDLDKKESSKEE